MSSTAYRSHTIRFGLEFWKFAKSHGCDNCECLYRGEDVQQIEYWVRRFDARDLRLLFGWFVDPFMLTSATEQQISRRLAWEIGYGDLCVSRQFLQVPQSSKKTAPAATPPPTSTPVRRSAPSPISEPEQPFFPPNFDPVAAAQVLKDAAQDGVPFCEECMKLAQQAQIAPTPAPGFPPDFDAAAAAQTLQEAAQDGVPFCEECRKMAQQSQATPTPASGFPPDFDAGAAAQALQESAQDGIPFCEECMKSAR